MLSDEMVKKIIGELQKAGYNVEEYEEGEEDGYDFIDDFSGETVHETGNFFLDIKTTSSFDFEKDYDLFSNLENLLPKGYELRINGE